MSLSLWIDKTRDATDKNRITEENGEGRTGNRKRGQLRTHAGKRVCSQINNNHYSVQQADLFRRVRGWINLKLQSGGIIEHVSGQRYTHAQGQMDKRLMFTQDSWLTDYLP